ncbi:MAG: indolepyruvate ferredoxin oxidoreductase [Muribaculaceae bacterium]|nr:indolepyruvate ferredoxin oxidoreductase [Muribaculaceae bacterium]
MKTQILLLGDEALALGALNAGLSGAYAYPGTPSTEIMEFIQMNPLTKERGIHCHWSSNEKTAVEEALGMSYAGKRSLASMKHVGVNVAADPLLNSAMTGANGGMLVIAADDPSMHSSQNEQDSRFYADFAMLPMLEPSSQQEAYEMAKYGFQLSEHYRIPVMLRMVTRLAHSRGNVTVDAEAEPENTLSDVANPRQWVLMPGNSRVRYKQLINDYADLTAESEKSPFNTFTDAPDHSLGIVVSGVANNYYRELWKDGKSPWPMVKISQYPLPADMLRNLVETCDEVLVIEEGQPFIEQHMRGVLNSNPKIHGRLDGYLPRTGELDPESVRLGVLKLRPSTPGLEKEETQPVPEVVVARPPALCKGCGHRDVYAALNESIESYPHARVFGDIGCYTLGYLAPFRAIHTVLDMGASITMAKGASEAGVHPAIAIIGDSTFTHSGMTGLLDAVNEDSDILVIISDNLTTGMTGGQDSQGTGKLEEICLGLGVNPEHLHTIDSLPKNHNDMVELFRNEIDHHGLSVVISRRECIQTARRSKK